MYIFNKNIWALSTLSASLNHIVSNRQSMMLIDWPGSRFPNMDQL